MVLAMHYCLLYSICFCSPLCSSYHLIIRTLFFFSQFLFSFAFMRLTLHTVPYVGYWGNPQEKAFSYLHSAHKCVFFAYVYFDTHSSGPVQVLHSTQTCSTHLSIQCCAHAAIVSRSYALSLCHLFPFWHGIRRHTSTLRATNIVCEVTNRFSHVNEHRSERV